MRYICGTIFEKCTAMDNYPTISLRYDRRHSATETRNGTVEMLVSFKSTKVYIATGVRVPRPCWKERVVNHPKAVELNKQLADALARVHATVSRLWNDGVFSIDTLKLALKQNPEPSVSPAEWMAERIEHHPVRESTRMHHRGLLKGMREFGRFLCWRDFTPANIAAWDAWLRGKGYSIGTVRNYHKRLKVYLAMARREGLMSADPYDGFKVERPKTATRKYLTDEQRDELEARPLAGPLAHARDLFIFQCYTGLSYADLYEFRIEEEDGERFIVGDRLKTGQHYRVMLLDKARAILERYGWQLPVITNQKYNYFLKIAAAGIRDDITSHMGRHTFATWALRNNVPIEIISAMLAHSDISVTQIYAEQQQAHVNEEFRRLNVVAEKSGEDLQASK